jgi:hypothetical protein
MRISRQEGDYEILHINQPTRTNIYTFLKKTKEKKKKEKERKEPKERKRKKNKKKTKKIFP